MTGKGMAAEAAPARRNTAQIVWTVVVVLLAILSLLGMIVGAGRYEQYVEELLHHSTPPEHTWLSALLHRLHIPDFLAVAVLVALLLGVWCFTATRQMRLFPSGSQNLLELIVEGFTSLCRNIMGELGVKYAPLIATLFLYILLMNYIGLVPGFISPTANPHTTLGLAIISIIIVHIVAIKENGLKHYLLHYVDHPVFVSILTTPLHVIGELAKVLSLSIRLFGNIFGEDTAIYQFAVLGILVMKSIGIPHFLKVPLPFQLPMLFLHMLVGFVQALVFSLLVAVYISIFLPHGEHEEHH